MHCFRHPGAEPSPRPIHEAAGPHGAPREV